jgi:hypothetical protein
MAALDRLRIAVELKPGYASSRAVFVSRAIYDERVRAGLTDSEPVLVKYTQQPAAFVLGGVVTVAKDSPLAPYANTLLVINVNEASRLVHPARKDGPDRVSRIDLFVHPGADVEQVLEGANRPTRSSAGSSWSSTSAPSVPSSSVCSWSITPWL